ncbi:hypothetical protein [Foetidibacter luteolus]|nr:hypothetical protein [Foetidibacter luteolus]
MAQGQINVTHLKISGGKVAEWVSYPTMRKKLHSESNRTRVRRNDA